MLNVKGHLEKFLTNLNNHDEAKIYRGECTEFPAKRFKDAISVAKRKGL